MIHINHKLCGGVAFLYSHRPRGGELVMASEARTLSGDPISPHSQMICGACGQPIRCTTDLAPGDEVKLGNGAWDEQPWA